MIKTNLLKIGKKIKNVCTIDNPNKLLKLHLIVIGIVLMGLVANGVYRESHAAGDLDPGETCRLDYFEEYRLKYNLEGYEAYGRHPFELGCATAVNYAVCINHNKPDIPAPGRTFRLMKVNSSPYWNSFSTLEKEGVSLATTYGYSNYSRSVVDSHFSGLNVDWQDTYWATQVLVWEYLAGYIPSHTGTPASSKEHRSLTYCRSGYTCNATAAYNRIRTHIQEHVKAPSFGVKGTSGNSTANLLKHSYQNANFSATLTDTNSSGTYGKQLKVKNNNGITVTNLSKASSGYQYKFATATKTNGTVITFEKNTGLSGSANQTPLVFDDPNDASLQELYVGSQPYNILFSTKVRTENPGYLTAVKTSDDISKQNDNIEESIFDDIKFEVTGNGLDSGDLVLNVNDEGKLTFLSGNEEVTKENTKGSTKITIYPGTYTLTEVDLPDRYRRAIKTTFTITEGNTTNITTPKTPVAGNVPTASEMDTYYMHNFIKMGYISIKKYYNNKDGAQIGNSHHLTEEEGAVFRVYAKDYADKGWTYDRIPALWKDTITTNANGYAKTKALPYGAYYVEQTVGKETQFKNDKFSTFIAEHEKVYDYVLFNEDVHSKIKLVKVDSETGKTIPIANTSFKILNMATNKYVKMSDGKPTPTMIDTFKTDESGTVTLNGHLTYGTYKVVEISAPVGYFKNPEGKTFSVTASEIEKANDGKVNTYEKPIVVTFSNKPQKADVKIVKKGEHIEKGTDGKPVVKTENLKYVEFSIVAAEDITTPDGTVRHKKGDTIKTDKTDANGELTFEKLYLGKYHIYEKAIYDRHTYYNYDLTDIDKMAESYKDLLIEDRIKDKNNETNEEVVPVNAPTDTDEDVNNNTNEPKTEEEQILKEIEEDVLEFRKIFDEKLYVTDDGAIYKEDGTNISDKFMIQVITEYNKLMPSGTYEHKLVKINTDYVFNPDKPVETLTIKYAGEETEVISISKDYLNKLKKGSFVLTKTDVSTGEIIPGASMKIYNDAGKVLCQGKTDKNGRLVCNNLPVGIYYFQEYDAPAGYILDTRKFKFEIKKNGEVKRATMTNKLDYTDVPITNSDKTFIVYVIASLFIIIGSGITIGIIKKEELINLYNKIKNKFIKA